MAEIHEPLCDGSHTSRQACNRALESGTGDGPVSVQPSAPPSGIETAEVLEAPPVVERRARREPVAEFRPALPEPVVDSSGATVQVLERDGMPAPSPWAVRAWEDTAAAVGATASPAPPPRPAPDETESEANPTSLAGHMLLLVGLVSAAALAILVIRRRRLR